MGKADVYLSASDRSFFSLFSLQHCPWTLGWDLLILPILNMVSGSYYPTWRKPISTPPTGICPQVLKSPPPTEAGQRPLQNNFNSVLTLFLLHATEKVVPAKHINILHFYPYTSAFSSLSPLFKMWTESGFYLISDLVQARISNTSGTISLMNCRWSY